MTDELSMEIPNEPQYLSVARLAVSGLANKMDFSNEAVEDIKVCLSEACNTVIENGKNKHKKESIDIHFEMNDDKLKIEVHTNGGDLDEKTWAKKHEMGKTFVEALMDDVEYIKDKKGTSVEMVKYLNGVANEPLKHKH